MTETLQPWRKKAMAKRAEDGHHSDALIKIFGWHCTSTKPTSVLLAYYRSSVPGHASLQNHHQDTVIPGLESYRFSCSAALVFRSTLPETV
jgi:hypothetical protein